MSFTVRYTNGNTLAEIADQTTNVTDTPIALVGRGAVNYGRSHAENFVHILENFAHVAAPARPITGMLWYDTSTKLLKLYDGTGWVLASSGGTGNTGTLAAGSRLGGFTGVTLATGTGTATVGLMMAEGAIIAAVSSAPISQTLLPPTVTIDGKTRTLSSRFPQGFKAGITLATDSAGLVFAGQSTSAGFADVAERYAASEALEPGDLVEIGGEKEIQKTRAANTLDVFGVISTAPGYMLNDAAGDDSTHPYVALTGRVPVKVFGTVKKGQRLVASHIPGVAMAADNAAPLQAVVGRALADKDTVETGLVEIVVAGVR